jgi:hypothetical protein
MLSIALSGANFLPVGNRVSAPVRPSRTIHPPRAFRISIITHSVPSAQHRRYKKHMTTPSLIIWFTLTGILLALYLTLFTWYLWPALIRKSHCAWCWKSLHLMQWYPRAWSSTICGRHDRQLCAQSAAHRARRLAESARLPAEVHV